MKHHSGYIPEKARKAGISCMENTCSEHPAGNAGGEPALWKAVITQALMDAGSNSRKPEMQKAKRDAQKWLTERDEDFVTVCLMADLCPDYVAEQARRAIARGCTWRNNRPPASSPVPPPSPPSCLTASPPLSRPHPAG